MSDEKTYCIYKHTSPSGKSYIGMSCNPEKRWNQGKGYMGNYHFWRAIQKYGWDNICHEIICNKLTYEQASFLEEFLIGFYCTTQRSHGYNIRDGGNGSFSIESRQKMSESRMGNQNAKGAHHSDDVRHRISQSLKKHFQTHTHQSLGKHLECNLGEDNAMARSVCCVDENERIIKIYGCIVDASNDTGCSAQSICNCCHGRKYSAKGYLWRYYQGGTAFIESESLPQKPRDNFKGVNNPAARRIVEIDSDGNIINIFDYAKLAANMYGLDLSAIIKCCKGKMKHTKGHIFKYLSEIDQPQADFFIA